MKAALNASFERSFLDALEAESVAQALSFGSREAREGALAFHEKRAPNFREARPPDSAAAKARMRIAAQP